MLGLSLVALNTDHSLVVVRMLLIEVASLVVDHRLQSARSVAGVHRLSRPETCGILPEQGWNPCLLNWQVDS